MKVVNATKEDIKGWLKLASEVEYLFGPMGEQPQKAKTGEHPQIAMTGEQPPKAMIQIGNKKYETTLGTYCWTANNQGTCVDKVGPVELLKGKIANTVNPS